MPIKRAKFFDIFW